MAYFYGFERETRTRKRDKKHTTLVGEDRGGCFYRWIYETEAKHVHERKPQMSKRVNRSHNSRRKINNNRVYVYIAGGRRTRNIYNLRAPSPFFRK